MIVTLDCNILVISLTSHSSYHNIITSLISGKFSLVITTDILLEYEEVISRKYNKLVANNFISLLTELPNVGFINTYYNWELIATDPEDNKYCDCAIAGRAEYLVTEDKHFNILQNVEFPKITTLNIDEFYEMLR